MNDTLVFLSTDQAYAHWATLFVRSLARHDATVRVCIHGVNLDSAAVRTLEAAAVRVRVSNACSGLVGHELAEYMANQRPLWLRDIMRREDSPWYLLADADLLVRKPLTGLLAAAADHDAALVFRPGVWGGRVWARLRVAAGLVLLSRRAGPLVDEWINCLHSNQAIEDVAPWAWYWEQTCLYLATTRVRLRYAAIPAAEYLDQYPFTPGSAIWSANVKPDLKPTVYQRFLEEFER